MTPFVFALDEKSGLPRLRPDPRLSDAEHAVWERELRRTYARLVRLDGRCVRFGTPLTFGREAVRFHVRVVPGQSPRCPTVELHTATEIPPEVEKRAAAILHAAPERPRKRRRAA
jgi:hypothetical protein